MKAYVTLCSKSNYLDGVLILHRSLRKVGAKYPLFVLLSHDIEDFVAEKLSLEGLGYFRLAASIIRIDVNEKGTFSHWNYSFDKLQVFGLTQFEKCVYLDADMLVLQNIDSLFEQSDFSAVCAGHSYPGNETWSELNSGLFVFTPNKKIEEELKKTAIDVVDAFRRIGKPVGDQDVLNKYISNWGVVNSLHLDEGYNVFASQLTYYIKHLGYSFDMFADRTIKVVHFIGRTKPFMIKGIKKYIWLIHMIMINPYYYKVYRQCRHFLSCN